VKDGSHQKTNNGEGVMLVGYSISVTNRIYI